MKIIKMDIPFSPCSIPISYTIGKNEIENTEIVNNANPNDIWFHVHNKSSCHVIAAIPDGILKNKKIKNKIINQGAVLCKQNSYPSQQRLPIMFTPIKYVKTTDIVGQVTIESNTFNIKHC